MTKASSGRSPGTEAAKAEEMEKPCMATEVRLGSADGPLGETYSTQVRRALYRDAVRNEIGLSGVPRLIVPGRVVSKLGGAEAGVSESQGANSASCCPGVALSNAPAAAPRSPIGGVVVGFPSSRNPAKRGFPRCRRRDLNPRHADYDSAALTS
jgi:hypothetical protein